MSGQFKFPIDGNGGMFSIQMDLQMQAQHLASRVMKDAGILSNEILKVVGEVDFVSLYKERYLQEFKNEIAAIAAKAAKDDVYKLVREKNLITEGGALNFFHPIVQPLLQGDEHARLRGAVLIARLYIHKDEEIFHQMKPSYIAIVLDILKSASLEYLRPAYAESIRDLVIMLEQEICLGEKSPNWNSVRDSMHKMSPQQFAAEYECKFESTPIEDKTPQVQTPKTAEPSVEIPYNRFRRPD